MCIRDRPISARNAENIAITGYGTVDGNGDCWRPVKKGKLTASQWKKLVNSGGVLDEKQKIWYPTWVAGSHKLWKSGADVFLSKDGETFKELNGADYIPCLLSTSILVLAETPSVAQSIAKVLGATTRKGGYMEGGNYIVSWCFGHLVELADASSYDERYAKWRYDDLPIVPESWMFEGTKDKAQQFKVLSALMKLSLIHI